MKPRNPTPYSIQYVREDTCVCVCVAKVKITARRQVFIARHKQQMFSVISRSVLVYRVTPERINNTIYITMLPMMY